MKATAHVAGNSAKNSLSRSKPGAYIRNGIPTIKADKSLDSGSTLERIESGVCSKSQYSIPSVSVKSNRSALRRSIESIRTSIPVTEVTRPCSTTDHVEKSPTQPQ